jgi:hypothetical protein
MTGVPDDTKYLLLVALTLVASGIGLLLIHWPTRRARSRKIAR